MRIIRYVATGEIAEVDHQAACDAIAAGEAVPCVDALPEKAAAAAPETEAMADAPEAGFPDDVLETEAAAAAPEVK